VAFNPKHNIYVLEQGKGGAAGTAGAGEASSIFDDVTISGTLTVGGEAKFAGDVNIDAGLTAQAVTVVNDLNLALTTGTYQGDPGTIGSYLRAVINGKLREYKRIATTGVWSADWEEKLVIDE
jgi:hypothetical protein